MFKTLLVAVPVDTEGEIGKSMLNKINDLKQGKAS